MKIKSQHQILMRFTWIEVVDTQRQRGRRGRRVGSKRKMNMEEMYEVLRFIEHGTQCRQSMDCVEGTILIYYLRDHPMVEKRILFEWFRQIGTSLDQFHRCRKGQCYRYLNPYSVVVTGEGVLLLMNLEAPENEFVMKKMQQRAVRVHFLRPAAARRAGQMRAADLFGFGRTMQFMLACTEVVPGLTHWEKARLTRIIGRCTESGRKLGAGLSIIVDILNPQAIVIGSIFTRSRNLLWKHARAVLETEALPLARKACKILPAKLGENIGDYAALSVAAYRISQNKL